MWLDFYLFIIFVNNVTRFYFFYFYAESRTVYFYLVIMFVCKQEHSFLINLLTFTKCALFTYKPVVPNCMYNIIITQEPNYKSGNIPRPWAVENIWSLLNFSSTRAVLKLFSTHN